MPLTLSCAELEAVWALAKFPVLRDAERIVTVPEPSLIIDYLGRHYPGPRELIPAHPEEAMRVHIWDRLFVPFAEHPKLSAYYERLCARPSFARVIDEARPYRHNFPLPWPASYA